MRTLQRVQVRRVQVANLSEVSTGKALSKTPNLDTPNLDTLGKGLNMKKVNKRFLPHQKFRKVIAVIPVVIPVCL